MSLKNYYTVLKIKRMFPEWKFINILNAFNNNINKNNPVKITIEELFSKYGGFRKRKHSCERNQCSKKFKIDTNKNFEIVEEELETEDPLLPMLKSIFPKAASTYLEYLIYNSRQSLTNDDFVYDHIINELLNNNYPKDTNTILPEIAMIHTETVKNDLIIKRIDNIKNKTNNSGSSVQVSSSVRNGVSSTKIIDLVNEQLTSLTDKQTIESSQPSTSHSYNKKTDLDVETESIYLKLLPIFPEADPVFLQNACKGKKNNAIVIEELISYLIGIDIPKRNTVTQEDDLNELNEENQIAFMTNILPDADPYFLRQHCQRLLNKPDELVQFVNNLLETKNYPTLKDSKRKQQLSAQVRQYTNEFNVESFLELIPNPKEYFSSRNNTTYNNNIQFYIQNRMRDIFTTKRVLNIHYELRKNNFNILKSFKSIQQIPHTLKVQRKRSNFDPNYSYDSDNFIPVVQEFAYVEHMAEIEQQILKKQEQYKLKVQNAKANNLLMECQCCCDNELLEEDTSCCEMGHRFCNSCIARSIEIAFGENRTNLSCLTDCCSNFSLTTLKRILKPQLFSKLAMKKQVEDIKAAGLEDLENCPFCDFINIPTPGDKIFKCLNSDCMRESCRLCHEPSHIPLRCDEVEKDDEVKARTYIENQMTEALLRKCYKCGLKFIKSDGCNRMTCSCGAHMCYICLQPVKDYKHFNGQGGSRFDLCPLYSDTNKLHLKNVIETGKKAKQEILQKNPKMILKTDPLTGLSIPKDTIQKAKRAVHFNEMVNVRFFPLT